MEHLITCCIEEVIQRTHNVKSFKLKADKELSYKAGQFISFTFNGAIDYTRYLSLSSSPTQKEYIEVTKKLTNSPFSQKLDSSNKGDLVKISMPMGRFVCEDDDQKIAFLSGGIGITPIISVLRSLYDQKKDVDIKLIYANKTDQDIAFKDELDNMVKDWSKLEVIHLLSEQEGSVCGAKGIITSELIKQSIPDFENRKFYLCGPPAMVDCMKKILINDLQLGNENILTENFMGY